MIRVYLTSLLILSCISTSLGQRLYAGWSFRPFLSVNTLEVDTEYMLSDYNWRVYRVTEPRQSGSWGSGAAGPTLYLDLFRLSLSASALPSYRFYKFTANQLISQGEYREQQSTLSEALLEIPLTAGITLFSGRPFKLYLEGGINYNIILGQDEDEPLLTGGNIYKNYLMDGRNYRDIIGGAGVRYKNMFLTLRKYVRDTPHTRTNLKSSFWTLNFMITLKNDKYLKNQINL